MQLIFYTLLSKEVRGVLTSKERGQNVALKSVLLAKKMVCPFNMSLDSYDKLFKMLAALNLLAVAIKLEVERKMKLQDVHNSVRSIIEKSDEFDELSIIYNSEDSRLILDLAGMQFQFERFNASDEIKEIINGHHNRVNGWNGTKSFFYSVELLEMANKYSIDE